MRLAIVVTIASVVYRNEEKLKGDSIEEKIQILKEIIQEEYFNELSEPEDSKVSVLIKKLPA